MGVGSERDDEHFAEERWARTTYFHIPPCGPACQWGDSWRRLSARRQALSLYDGIMSGSEQGTGIIQRGCCLGNQGRLLRGAPASSLEEVQERFRFT